jgi:hypothetical protein
MPPRKPVTRSLATIKEETMKVLLFTVGVFALLAIPQRAHAQAPAVLKAVVTLTDSDIKALPTTPF